MVSLKNTVRMRHVLIGEVHIDGGRVECARRAGILQQGLELAGEEESVRFEAVEQRLLAEAVASEKQLFSPVVPDGQREHAAEVSDAVGTVLLVKVDDGLGVAMRAEAMAAGFEVRPQLAVVVDFAVEGNPDRLVLVRQRLSPGGEVDNR